MNNKLNNMINAFLEKEFTNQEKVSDEELQAKMNEFMEKYNNGEIDYVNTPLDDAYEILEKAMSAKTEKQAIKLAKQAYEMCSACFDAILFQVDLETDDTKKMELLNNGLLEEKKRLEKEKLFEKDNIGNFYTIFETRPYIKGLLYKVEILVEEGKIKQARDLCLEILKLNNSDNTGIRYMLMAIYAFLEDEKEMLSLYEKYPEDNIEMLIPLFTLYYKLGEDKKAQKYIEKADKCNKNLVKYFKGTIDIEDDVPFGYYGRGQSSEVFMYLDKYDFLLQTVPNIDDYVIKNLKNKKKKG